jgi:hypothetical protein
MFSKLNYSRLNMWVTSAPGKHCYGNSDSTGYKDISRFCHGDSQALAVTVRVLHCCRLLLSSLRCLSHHTTKAMATVTSGPVCNWANHWILNLERSTAMVKFVSVLRKKTWSRHAPPLSLVRLWWSWKQMSPSLWSNQNGQGESCCSSLIFFLQ